MCLHEGDVIEAWNGGAVIALGAYERFEVYPGSVVALRGDTQPWWPGAGHWLSRLKAALVDFGETRPSQSSRPPVIAVRG